MKLVSPFPRNVEEIDISASTKARHSISLHLDGFYLRFSKRVRNMALKSVGARSLARVKISVHMCTTRIHYK